MALIVGLAFDHLSWPPKIHGPARRAEWRGMASRRLGPQKPRSVPLACQGPIMIPTSEPASGWLTAAAAAPCLFKFSTESRVNLKFLSGPGAAAGGRRPVGPGPRPRLAVHILHIYIFAKYRPYINCIFFAFYFLEYLCYSKLISSAHLKM